jgi:HEAT repeat protein
MEQLSPQVMHKLVFTVLVHGLPDAQTGIALEVLLEAQQSPNAQVRELAVVALAELPVTPAKRVVALVKSMQDSSARVRRRAARALGDFGMHALPAVPALTAGLRDQDTSVRRDSAGALGRLGPAAMPAIVPLVTLLGEPDTRTRVVVAATVKRIGRLAIPALLDGLGHSNPDTRAHAATLLAKIAPEDEAVAAALRSAANDRDDDVRKSVGEALSLVELPYPSYAGV